MQQFDIKKPLPHKPLFNPDGDTDVLKRRMIGGNTTNLNDYNNLKYTWASEWYRQAMNNFWIPEEVNLSQDLKDYQNLLYDLNACMAFNQGLIKGVAKEHFESLSGKDEKVKIVSIKGREAVHFQHKMKDRSSRDYILKKGETML